MLMEMPSPIRASIAGRPSSVAGTFTDSYPKQGQLEPTPFRFEVTLVKVQGSWLVDDFTPVTGAEQ